MIKGQYKKILFDVFDVLGFMEDEKEKALDGFKKKFANGVLIEIKGSLSENQRQWIAEVAVKKEYDKTDPNILEIQKTIESIYPEEKMDEISKKVFKTILTSYINFMSQKVDPEKSEQLKKIAEAI
ncbi:MAG: hypothetical protein Q7S43_03500 [bacterium]|nr:hypothetical protein [bacterium]